MELLHSEYNKEIAKLRIEAKVIIPDGVKFILFGGKLYSVEKHLSWHEITLEEITEEFLNLDMVAKNE